MGKWWEHVSITGMCLRLCLVSNLVMMLILIHLQFTMVPDSHRRRALVDEDALDPSDMEIDMCPGENEKTKVLDFRKDKKHVYIPIRRYREAYPYATDPDDPDPQILITSWTDRQPGMARWYKEGQDQFKWCPNLHNWMKCHYTMDRRMIERSHAVLFHIRHMSKKRGVPKRLPHQKWIFYEVEAPPNVWNYADPNWDFWHLFNLTATFSKDSDIPYPLHAMRCRPRLDWRLSAVNHAANKRGKVAWFVSHCNSSSRRELYVEELRKYIQVDIYGMCGNESVCNRDLNQKNTSFNWAGCMLDFLSTNYKFYLSFENAFCMDYVTEKLHRIFPINIIPIVLGQVDYDNWAPKGTFINVRDFESPRHLARYLHHIDKKDHVYNKYIETKNSYECRGKVRGSLRWHCRLCEYLHLHRYENQQVYDAHAFWSVKNRCMSPKDFFSGVADSIVPRIKFTVRPDLYV